MQPRQSQAQARSGGRASAAARPSLAGAAAAKAVAVPRQSAQGTSKARTRTVSSSSDGPAISVIKKKPASVKKANQVWKWHLGPIYAGFGIFDVVCRFTGMLLWRFRYESFAVPTVSATQIENIFTGKPTENMDFMRLVITGSNSVIRCAANAIILWHAFADLRPAWGLRLMRWITPLFRALLVIWVFADLMQAFIPNIPPANAESITTPHIVFAQMAMWAANPAYFIMLVVMFFDLDSSKPSLIAGMFTSVALTFSHIYLTFYMFKGDPEKRLKAIPMGWAEVTEVAFLTFNVGLAMPERIIAMPGDLGKQWYPRFLREGKVRVYEDTSARTGSKPLLMTGDQQADEALPEDEDAFLRRQQAELAALNAQFRSIFGAALDSLDVPEEASAADAEAGGASPGIASPGTPATGLPVATATEDADDEPDF